MVRALLEGFVLFLVPFAGFAIYLMAKGQNPLHPEVWSRKALSWLTIAALMLCIASMLILGAKRESRQGSFIPSHIDKDGRFVPGEFKR